jgi:hypothetical protein
MDPPFLEVGAMEEVDRELLTGMGNCYAACHEDFEETVGMVAGSRDRDPEEVKRTLLRLQADWGSDPEYRRLRARLPEAFPF